MDTRLISRPFLAEFIQLYKEHPCLWNMKSRDYNDKYMKSDAYKVLTTKLKEIDPEASRDTVVRKINSVRTCYRKELKKYQASLGTDRVYKPTLWYFNLLNFLVDEYEGDATNDLKDDTINDFVKFEKEDDNQIEWISEFVDPLEASTPSLPSASQKEQKRKKFNCEDHELMKIVPKKVESCGKYTSFGQYIAEELRELTPEMAMFCKKIINDAIFLAQLEQLNAQSRIV